MPAAGSPCLTTVARSSSVRKRTRAAMAGPSSPPLPSLPWHPAQRLTKACRPESGGWASAIAAGNHTYDKTMAISIHTPIWAATWRRRYCRTERATCVTSSPRFFEREGEWHIAYSPEIPGANGQGQTKEVARQSLAAAIALILADRRDDALRGVPPGAPRETVIVE